MSDLFFIASKLAHVLVEPDSLLVLVLAIGAALLWRRPRLGRALVSLAAVLLLVASCLPIGSWLLAPLENRFPRPDLATLGQIDGIVVLGGAVKPDIAEARGVLALNGHAERLAEAIMLAHRFPTVRMVLSGGSADVRGERITEAAALAPYLADLGLPADRVILEATSRNTFENARDTWALVRPKPGERWLLVTSAFHMPRSVGAFRAVGWEPVPYSVDYQTSGRERWPVLNPAGHLRDLRLALHEYSGLLAYHWAGYSNSVIPGLK